MAAPWVGPLLTDVGVKAMGSPGGELALLIFIKRSLSGTLLHWLHHLGSPGLILLGILDNSLVPVPGSLDALTIVLAAGQRDWWPYYAAVATVGSMVGGYLTYRLAQKGGNEPLKRRVRRSTMKKVETIFSRWGFWAIAIAAVSPPPVPMVPFLLAAGATKYSRGKFLGALALGRSIRYGILAFLAAIYGRQILRLLSHHLEPTVIVAIVLVLIGAGAGTFFVLRQRRESASR